AWYRLWVRPFVPDLDKIPDNQRKLYEEHMCTTPHNPNNVDLSRDVLFQLTTPEKSRKDVRRIDENLWKHIDKAVEVLENISSAARKELGRNNVIDDQLVRIKALHCWFMTQRNVAAWIAGVYGYMNAMKKTEKNRHRKAVKDMIIKEIGNSRNILELLRSDVEFIALTDKGETPLIYGANISDLIKVRIRLMQNHIDDIPHIDHDYMMRKAGEPVY
ncbi:hypothetical protein ACFL6G_07535, partial [candidate division KSB1 bacterium]